MAASKFYPATPLPSQIEHFRHKLRVDIASLDSIIERLADPRIFPEDEQSLRSYRSRIGILTTLADAELRRRVQVLFEDEGDYDRILREVGVILEHRVRQRINAPGSSYGVDLMTEAFRKTSGKLIVSDFDAEQDAIHQLSRGFIGFFKNPTSHRIIEGYTKDQAEAVVRFADILLGIVAAAQDRVS